MEVKLRNSMLSLSLAMLATILGGWMPGILLADYGPSMWLRFLLASLPFVVIPLIIGWLTPSLWWLAAGGAFLPMLFTAVALATALPQTFSDLLARSPLLLPLFLTLLFALLGRFLRRRYQTK